MPLLQPPVPVPQLPLMSPPLAVPAPQMAPAAVPGHRLVKRRLVIDEDCWPIQVRTTWTDQQTGGIVRTAWNQYTARAVTALKKSKSENDFTRTEHKVCELDNRLRRRHRNHNRN